MPRYHPPAMTRTTRDVSLLALAVLLIALLLVLVPNLQQIELAPGRPPDLSASTGVETGVPDLGTGSAGARARARAGAVHVLLRVLMIVAVAAFVFIAAGSLFRKELRPYLLLYGTALLLILGLHYYFANKPRGDVAPETAEIAVGDRAEARTAPSDEEQPIAPPRWSFAAVALAISLAVVILASIAWAKLAPRWSRRARTEGKTEMAELLDTVVAAADEIQLGGDPRSAVLRCYREMVRILCAGRRIDHVHMTARELADALHRAGFAARHVDQLTEIFELVRYGNRRGQALAEHATACLAAIRRAYAT